MGLVLARAEAEEKADVARYAARTRAERATTDGRRAEAAAAEGLSKERTFYAIEAVARATRLLHRYVEREAAGEEAEAAVRAKAQEEAEARAGYDAAKGALDGASGALHLSLIHI